LDTGQPFLAPSACSWKALLSIPGTWASVVSSMRVMPNPSPTFSRWTRAAVWMRVGGWPALVRPAERALEKQPAWAAAISSSGLDFPSGLPMRVARLYGSSNAPEERA
jgi:hypothetical protein